MTHKISDVIDDIIRQLHPDNADYIVTDIKECQQMLDLINKRISKTRIAALAGVDVAELGEFYSFPFFYSSVGERVMKMINERRSIQDGGDDGDAYFDTFRPQSNDIPEIYDDDDNGEDNSEYDELDGGGDGDVLLFTSRAEPGCILVLSDRPDRYMLDVVHGITQESLENGIKAKYSTLRFSNIDLIIVKHYPVPHCYLIDDVMDKLPGRVVLDGWSSNWFHCSVQQVENVISQIVI